ncbi:MAG: helix-turn-helix transcriptional regulator [Lentisphaeria bacterium]|nr:helix-turn-helix transcriptional regulator [Lentisphaeria bacterium]
MIELLYWSIGPAARSEKILLHRHDYCQLEVILQSRRRCCLSDRRTLALTQGDAVFIPQGVLHGFAPAEVDDLKYLSFKFRLDKTDTHLPETPYAVKHDFMTDFLINSFRELALKCSTAGSPLHLELLNGLLDMFVKHILREHRTAPEPELLKKMREQIFRHGAKCSVSSTAEALGLSLPQLRNKFRKAMHSLPPEAAHYSRPAGFIAAELTAIAGRHLQESDLEISRIAELLQFNNIYTFSRFFKHNTGFSPQAYRKKNRRF